LGWSWASRFLRRGGVVGPQGRQGKCYESGIVGLAEMHSLAVEGCVMTETNLIRTGDSVPYHTSRNLGAKKRGNQV
jgi:hypothetical protein